MYSLGRYVHQEIPRTEYHRDWRECHLGCEWHPAGVMRQADAKGSLKYCPDEARFDISLEIASHDPEHPGVHVPYVPFSLYQVESLYADSAAGLYSHDLYFV